MAQNEDEKRKKKEENQLATAFHKHNICQTQK
jgi:hypothetical protein